MTKSNLIQVLADRLNLTKAQANLFLDSLVDVAAETLEKEGTFVIPNLVKFSVKEKPATAERRGVNPFTKEAITIAAKPATKKVKASPVGDLKKSVSG